MIHEKKKAQKEDVDRVKSNDTSAESFDSAKSSYNPAVPVELSEYRFKKEVQKAEDGEFLDSKESKIQFKEWLKKRNKASK